MRIGHQIYITLDEWTDNGSYDVQEILFYQNARGQWICIKCAYIDYRENQVYLVVEDEDALCSSQVTIHQFLKLMGGPQKDSYQPLYQLRNELCDYKKGLIARQKYARLVAELGLIDNMKYSHI